MGRNLTEARLRVIPETSVIFTEVTKREAVQMPFVRGVAEGTEVGVVRGHDEYAASRFKQTMEFFDGPYDVGNVFDQVDRTDFSKGTVLKREREVVKIGNDVGIGVRIPIDPDSAWIFLDPAADVENTVAYIIRC